MDMIMIIPDKNKEERRTRRLVISLTFVAWILVAIVVGWGAGRLCAVLDYEDEKAQSVSQCAEYKEFIDSFDE